MEIKVKAGISNRHVHLSEEVYYQLFDEELVKIKDLKQTGEFASNKFVTLKGPKGTIEKVRILGPFRSYNQVEVSNSDSYTLGIMPPVRKSGHLENSETITLIGDKGEITLVNACIIAECHIHMNTKDLEKYKVQDDQIVEVVITGERKGILYAHIKASENGVLELHLDRDEANAFFIKNEEELTVIL